MRVFIRGLSYLGLWSQVSTFANAGLSNDGLGVVVGGTHDAVLIPNPKQVVFFAGPHYSSEEEVENFLHHYVESGWRRGHPHTKGLRYWRWPSPDDDKIFNEHIFDNLVTAYDDVTLRKQILDSIQSKWVESENGIILGTELFDQVGMNAEQDAMTGMQSVLNAINVPASNVTVILNYRTPRLEQWMSIWKNAEVFSDSYKNFMCDSYDDPDLRKTRESQIGASMNAMGAAYEFLSKGWSVKLIDLEGVHKLDKDVVHAIACDILLGECKDGKLMAHTELRAPEEDLPAFLEEIGQEESDKIEMLFRYRDCGYRNLLKPFIESGDLEVLYEDSIWNDCDDDKELYYEALANQDRVAYTALLSQLECEAISGDTEIYSMDEALGIGEYENALRSNSAGIGGFFSNVLVPVVLVGAVCYAILVGYRNGKLKNINLAVRHAEKTEMGGMNLAATTRAYADEGVDNNKKTSLSLIT